MFDGAKPRDLQFSLWEDPCAVLTELSSRLPRRAVGPERSAVEKSAVSFLWSALLQPVHQVYLRQQPGIAVHVRFTIRAEENIRQIAKPSLV
jgi:hypothetical protein